MATVVDSKFRDSHRRSSYYDVTLEFHTSEGVRQRAVVKRISSSTLPNKPGSQASIFYNTTNPAKVRPDVTSYNWGISLGIAVVGFIFIAVIAMRDSAHS